MSRALIVVDVQNDFVSGSLAVPDGPEVAEAIGLYLKTDVLGLNLQDPLSVAYDLIVATQDWHIEPGEHWALEGTEPDFVETWPVHCQANTSGAYVHDAVMSGFGVAATAGISVRMFRKGAWEAAYSGFEAHAVASTETLLTALHKARITALDVCGIATDYCVQATVLDALKFDFDVRVLTELVAAVSEETGNAALAAMEAAGATLSPRK